MVIYTDSFTDFPEFIQTDLLIFQSTPNIKCLTIKLFRIFSLPLIRKIISIFSALVQYNC